MELILAEQLLLLHLDDETGDNRANWGGDPGLAGAILLDLTAAGALTESGGKLVACGTAPPHPLLAAAHAAIAGSDERRDAKDWVGRLPRELAHLRNRTAERLVERGVLTAQTRSLLGLFPSKRFPQSDPGPERELRERIRAVLLDERASRPPRRRCSSPS